MGSTKPGYFKHVCVSCEILYRFDLCDSISCKSSLFVLIFLNCRILINYIPVLRNERNGWVEYVTTGLVTGTLAGFLFGDSDALGFERRKLTGRLSYKHLCLARGVGYGLLFGIIGGAYSHISGERLTVDELRKWEKYWKRRLEVHSATIQKSHMNKLIYCFVSIFFRAKSLKAINPPE